MSEEPWVFLRDEFVPASRAALSIYDMGIVLGATVTDLLRTFGQRPYRPDAHVRRFYDSCKYARLEPPFPPELCLEVTERLIAHNAALLRPQEELAGVYFITPGENLLYAGSASAGVVTPRPTFCIHTFPLRFALFRRFFVEGIHLVVPPTRHVPPQCVDPKIKNRSRLHWWLAEQEAHLADPAAIPLLLDLDGNLTETSGANVLLVKNGVVLSPPPRNILLGISRAVVQEICARLDIPFRERDLQLYDALTADEAFVTTTPYCMAPVSRVNGLTIAEAKTGGPVFERILAEWSADVGVDIRAQILEEEHAAGA
jgi:branched-chain amino acid aminotransferase